ncbi:hypothetical protein [Herbaspirillum sp.]|uniref:hypothetical protein n=1 Tax=Herbaspirillum sp. TaxID=1890675 RepID=UPI0031DD9339
MDKHAPPGTPAAAASGVRGKRSGGEPAPAAGHKPPRPETEALEVPEPDGTEDPGASADDGLMPEQGARGGGEPRQGKR